MDPFWLEAAKQAPALAVLCFVVMQFLKHIREIVNDFKGTIEETNVMMNDQHKLFRERTERALESNTSALAKNNILLDQFNRAAGNGRLCENFRPVSQKEDS